MSETDYRGTCLKALSVLEKDIRRHDRATVTLIIRTKNGQGQVFAATSESVPHAAYGALTQVASDQFQHKFGPQTDVNEQVKNIADSFDGSESVAIGAVEQS